MAVRPEGLFLPFGPLGDFKKTLVANPCPSSIASHRAVISPSTSNGIEVSTCFEFKDRYEIRLTYQGKELADVTGKLNSDFVIYSF